MYNNLNVLRRSSFTLPFISQNTIAGATESLKAVRAMEILGMILLGLALVFGVLKLCGKKDQLALFVAAGCLAIVAGKHLLNTLLSIILAFSLQGGPRATD